MYHRHGNRDNWVFRWRTDTTGRILHHLRRFYNVPELPRNSDVDHNKQAITSDKRPGTLDVQYVTPSWKFWLMEEQKEQTLIASSDQSLYFLLHISNCRKQFSRFLHNLKTIYEYEYEYIEKAILVMHCLLFYNVLAGFLQLTSL